MLRRLQLCAYPWQTVSRRRAYFEFRLMIDARLETRSIVVDEYKFPKDHGFLNDASNTFLLLVFVRRTILYGTRTNSPWLLTPNIANKRMNASSRWTEPNTFGALFSSPPILRQKNPYSFSIFNFFFKRNNASFSLSFCSPFGNVSRAGKLKPFIL